MFKVNNKETGTASMTAVCLLGSNAAHMFSHSDYIRGYTDHI